MNDGGAIKVKMRNKGTAHVISGNTSCNYYISDWQQYPLNLGLIVDFFSKNR